MHIYAYFEQMLGRPPTDESLRELPVTSNCGEDCRKAIFAAKQLIDCVRMAVGAGTPGEQDIISAVDHTIRVYWRG